MVKTELRIVSLSCEQLPSFYLEYKSNSKYFLCDQLRLGMTELNPMERFRYKHCKSEPEILIPYKQGTHYSWETGYLNSLERDGTQTLAGSIGIH